LPEGDEVEVDLGEGGGAVLGSGGEGDDEAAGLVDEELDLALPGIDDPVLADSGFGVKGELLPAVAADGPWRQDFGEEVGWTLDSFAYQVPAGVVARAGTRSPDGGKGRGRWPEPAGVRSGEREASP
jgi:hypothetical protein